MLSVSLSSQTQAKCGHVAFYIHMYFIFKYTANGTRQTQIDVIRPMSLQPKGLKRGRESGWVGDVISPMSLQPKGLKRGRESGWVEGCHKSNEPSAQRTKKREGEWVGGGMSYVQ